MLNFYFQYLNLILFFLFLICLAPIPIELLIVNNKMIIIFLDIKQKYFFKVIFGTLISYLANLNENYGLKVIGTINAG